MKYSERVKLEPVFQLNELPELWLCCLCIIHQLWNHSERSTTSHHQSWGGLAWNYMEEYAQVRTQVHIQIPSPQTLPGDNSLMSYISMKNSSLNVSQTLWVDIILDTIATSKSKWSDFSWVMWYIRCGIENWNIPDSFQISTKCGGMRKRC